MKKSIELHDNLQALLTGEANAIHLYDKFIPEIKDPELMTGFQEIRSGHRRHLDQLTRRMEELNFKPEIKPNLTMKLSQLLIDLRTSIGIAPEKMVKWAVKGEEMGIEAGSEIVTDDLDEVSKELVDNMLLEINEFINKLNNFVRE